MFETVASACSATSARDNSSYREPTAGTARGPITSALGPMLDSPDLRIAVRRNPLPVERDLRSTTVPDDPVQRRDLILLERARDGDLDAFNDLVTLYQDQLYALVVRMVPDRDQAADAVQEGFFSAFRNLHTFRGGSVKAWLNRICVNAAMDTAARPPPPPVAAVSRARGRQLAAAGRRGRRSGAHRGPGRTHSRAGRRPRVDHGRPANGDRAVRHRGLRLRRDRRDDRCFAGNGQVAHPSREIGAPRPAGRPDGAVSWLSAGPRGNNRDDSTVEYTDARTAQLLRPRPA